MTRKPTYRQLLGLPLLKQYIQKQLSLLTPINLLNRLNTQLELIRKNNNQPRYLSIYRQTRLPVQQKSLETMPNSVEPCSSNCPATLTKFLEGNLQFASTCPPHILEKGVKGQTPSLFWLGCSDSRVAEGLVVKAQPGEVFVHRNVANVFNPQDTSALAALAFAVNYLKISHVVVVGHESCGGCQAALAAALASEGTEEVKSDEASQGATDLGEAAITKWIQPIKNLATEEIKKCKNQNLENLNLSQLVKLNVKTQVENIVNHQIIQNAWARGQDVSVHGWLYDLSTGKINELGLNHFKP